MVIDSIDQRKISVVVISGRSSEHGSKRAIMIPQYLKPELRSASRSLSAPSYLLNIPCLLSTTAFDAGKSVVSSGIRGDK